MFRPSISSLSLLFQVCWLTRSCMIWSSSTTWLNNLLLISSLLESGCSLYSRSQALPVSHTLIRGTTGGCWEPSPPVVGRRRSLTSLQKSSKLFRTFCSVSNISSSTSPSSSSSTSSSAASSSSEAGVVTMGAFPLTRWARSVGSPPSSSSSPYTTKAGLRTITGTWFIFVQVSSHCMSYKSRNDSGRLTCMVPCLLF